MPGPVPNAPSARDRDPGTNDALTGYPRRREVRFRHSFPPFVMRSHPATSTPHSARPCDSSSAHHLGSFKRPDMPLWHARLRDHRMGPLVLPGHAPDSDTAAYRFCSHNRSQVTADDPAAPAAPNAACRASLRHSEGLVCSLAASPVSVMVCPPEHAKGAQTAFMPSVSRPASHDRRGAVAQGSWRCCQLQVASVLVLPFQAERSVVLPLVMAIPAGQRAQGGRRILTACVKAPSR